MKKLYIFLTSVVLLPAFALAGDSQGIDLNGPNLGTDMAGLAALGLVSLIVGAQMIKRRKK